jgi:hypothetical protein
MLVADRERADARADAEYDEVVANLDRGGQRTRKQKPMPRMTGGTRMMKMTGQRPGGQEPKLEPEQKRLKRPERKKPEKQKKSGKPLKLQIEKPRRPRMLLTKKPRRPLLELGPLIELRPLVELRSLIELIELRPLIGLIEERGCPCLGLRLMPWKKRPRLLLELPDGPRRKRGPSFALKSERPTGPRPTRNSLRPRPRLMRLRLRKPRPKPRRWRLRLRKLRLKPRLKPRRLPPAKAREDQGAAEELAGTPDLFTGR